MHVTLLSVVKKKLLKYDVNNVRINGTFTRHQIILPTKTVHGSWIWPGQYVWQYKHAQMCLTGNKGMFYKLLKLHLTDEEYIMSKLEN